MNETWWHSPGMAATLWSVIVFLSGLAIHQHRRIRNFEDALAELRTKFEPVYEWFMARIKGE